MAALGAAQVEADATAPRVWCRMAAWSAAGQFGSAAPEQQASPGAAEEEGAHAAAQPEAQDGTLPIDALGHAGFLVNENTQKTGEGIGSCSRWFIYPFVQIAVDSGLLPVFRNANVRDTNVGRNYKTVDVASFLRFDQRYSYEFLYEHTEVITIDLPKFPESAPKTDDLVETCKSHIRGYTGSKPLTIKIVGQLSTTQPTRSCIDWLQGRSQPWRVDRGLKVAVHIRRGDTIRAEHLQEKYHIRIYVEILKKIQELQPKMLEVVVDVITEDNFQREDEAFLRSAFPEVMMKVHRGTTDTMLEDLRLMACADVLVPSASCFSQLGGHMLQPEGIIVTQKSGNYQAYFRAHIEHQKNVFSTSDPGLDGALRKVLTAKGIISDADAAVQG